MDFVETFFTGFSVSPGSRGRFPALDLLVVVVGIHGRLRFVVGGEVLLEAGDDFLVLRIGGQVGVFHRIGLVVVEFLGSTGLATVPCVAVDCTGFH